MKKLFLIFPAAIIFLFLACSKPTGNLTEGTWRAVLETDAGVEIPFNFIVADSGNKKTVTLINGEERIQIDDVEVSEHSVVIKLPLFESEIRADFTGRGLKGEWIRHLANKDVSMPFEAQSNTDWRFFKTKEKPQRNVSGRWSVLFTSPDGQDSTIAVGEFKQDGSRLTGTFLTTAGDYRYLQGTVTGKKLYLSTFDGSHAFLFTANIANDAVISDGKFYAGSSSIENWTARKDSNAILPDAYSLTHLKPGEDRLNFVFPNLNGQNVSLSDSAFKNKVTIVQFLGTWCPNCMDETAYLSPFYKQYRDKGVEVIGLAYERTTDFERSKKNLLSLKKRFDVAYPLLITGYTNKEVKKSIPELKDFKAFPTTIIVDKTGKVRKIHTGFTGPGTGSHYQDFKREFEDYVNSLLAE